jgi:hypothetical protein
MKQMPRSPLIPAVHRAFIKQKSMEPQISGNIEHLLSLSAGQCKHLRRNLMLNRLMMTAAAAALIAGTGFANAQGMNREAPSSGAGMQQGTPSGGSPAATPMNRDGASDQGMKSSQSEEKMQPQGGKTQRSQNDMKAAPKTDKSAQDTKTNTNPNMKAEERGGNMNAEKSAADSKSAPDSKSQTVGQAGAGGKLSSEQRTKITTVIRSQHVAPVTNVNFSISVGTRVPREVSFHPLPTEIVTIYPEWRGYEFILVNDQIVVVDPRTYEIVAVLDA